jgi:endonuclease YncB( thermonuclease family)
MRTLTLIPILMLAVAYSPVRVQADARADLILGEYELDRNNGVVDGDTIRCWKLDGGVRMLCVDCEETFKSLEDRRAAGKDWDAYATEKAKANDLPVKYGSFMGEEAWHYARDFFKDVKTVRLEYDTLVRKKDIYGRHLCYVLATPAKEKKEKNFCVELVREGYSPYSAKYGHSERFRKDFESAEKEAREAKRGIWGEKPMGYRDYDVRTKWWNERAEQLTAFRKDYAGKGNAIELTNDDTGEKLEAHVGKEVVLLCNMPEFKDGLYPDENPPRIWFTATQDAGLHLYLKDVEMFTAVDPGKLRGKYVVVKGKLEKHGRDWKLTLKRAEDFIEA